MVTWMDLLRIGLKLVISDDHIHPKKTFFFFCEVLVFTKLILGSKDSTIQKLVKLEKKHVFFVGIYFINNCRGRFF